MTDLENKNVEPTDDVETTEAVPTDGGYSAEEPYVSDTGNRYWVADGRTYRETPDGSLYVTDGDHIATVIALSELSGS